MTIWLKHGGRVNKAFRLQNGFEAVTNALESLHKNEPEIAGQLARRIARNLGVLAQGRNLDDDDLQDRSVFRDFKQMIGGLPFSDADKQALIDLAKGSEIVTEP